MCQHAPTSGGGAASPPPEEARIPLEFVHGAHYAVPATFMVVTAPREKTQARVLMMTKKDSTTKIRNDLVSFGIGAVRHRRCWCLCLFGVVTTCECCRPEFVHGAKKNVEFVHGAHLVEPTTVVVGDSRPRCRQPENCNNNNYADNHHCYVYVFVCGWASGLVEDVIAPLSC